ncbi:nucleoside hydrolase [Microbacterium nymphoidis]|uniref:nucleoside hydrolase n=1 Tax=Microbacterium nymphoidis TaxID=2898586 RepID=UPI001E614308|nr:nucleoside hydrolase [Microbacterium nymphoidis]MCD2498849.1 nucleoside hydrolase [Microbacterium nymphoidis]
MIASSAGIPRIVLESDMFADVDDVGALAIALHLAQAGIISLDAVGINTPSRWGPRTAAVVCAHHGADVPIGHHARTTDDVWENDYARAVAEHFASTPGRTPEPATLVLRRALAAAEDGAITVTSIGFFANLNALLASAPDEWSALSGAELVERKVGRTVVMGGQFPWGREFNLAEHAPEAMEFLDSWPGSVDFVGFETTEHVVTGRHLAERLGAENPVALAYETFCGVGVGRPSWDLLTIYLAAFPDSPLVTWSPPGELVLERDGWNRWTTGGKTARHRHALVTVGETELAAVLDAWLEGKVEAPRGSHAPV